MGWNARSRVLALRLLPEHLVCCSTPASVHASQHYLTEYIWLLTKAMHMLRVHVTARV